MKHDIYRRFGFIETLAYWGDGITAGRLAQAFGIARQNAQKTLDAYRDRHPEQLFYDPSLKRHRPTRNFRPHYTSVDVGRFLEYQRGLHLTGRFLEEPDGLELPFVDVDVLHPRRTYTGAARAVLVALRSRQAIYVLYNSRHERSWRRLSPHTLVHADMRYHVRAYCERLANYGDFVISRMEEAEDPDASAWISDAEDRSWHTYVTVEYRINPALPPETQRMIRHEYGLGDNASTLKMRTRKALAQYVRRSLGRVDPLLGLPRFLVEEEDGWGGD